MNHVAQIPPPPAPAPASLADIPDRLRRWHPRFVVCAVCTGPTAGFGFRDPPQQNRFATGSLSEVLVLFKTLSGALRAQSPERTEHG